MTISTCDFLFTKSPFDLYAEKILDSLSTKLHAVEHYYTGKSMNDVLGIVKETLTKFGEISNSNPSVAATDISKMASTTLDYMNSNPMEVNMAMNMVHDLHEASDRVVPSNLLDVVAAIEEFSGTFKDVNCMDSTLRDIRGKIMMSGVMLESTDAFNEEHGCSLINDLQSKTTHELYTFCDNMQNLGNFSNALVSAQEAGNDIMHAGL